LRDAFARCDVRSKWGKRVCQFILNINGNCIASETAK
jgi:hypothetical protein